MATTRKAISKKTRFEVFKRDDFACSYCGQKPPAVVLEVDHIVPVAKGGKNGMDNLITACFDCNRGKAANTLTAVPESLVDKAARVKEAEAQLKAYRKVMAARDEREKADAWAVVHALFGDDCHEIRKDWFQSIKRFNDRLEHHDVIYAAERACVQKPYATEAKFKYFCGICWNLIKRVDGDA